MATNYPASLDSLTNPGAGDALTSPSHSPPCSARTSTPAMAQMSITISDALAAKIAAHWGNNQAYKDWIKAATREVLKEAA